MEFRRVAGIPGLVVHGLGSAYGHDGCLQNSIQDQTEDYSNQRYFDHILHFHPRCHCAPFYGGKTDNVAHNPWRP